MEGVPKKEEIVLEDILSQGKGRDKVP